MAFIWRCCSLRKRRTAICSTPKATAMGNAE